jgi:hypothetical protein
MIYGDDNIHDAMEKVALSKELILRAQKKALHQAKLLSKAGKHGPAARRGYQAYSVFRPPGHKGRGWSKAKDSRPSLKPSGHTFLSAREVSKAEKALQSKVKVASDDNIHTAIEKVAAPRYIKNIAKGKVKTKEPFLQSLADARNFGKSQRKLPPANRWDLPSSKRRSPWFVPVTGKRPHLEYYRSMPARSGPKRSKRLEELAAKYRIGTRPGQIHGQRSTRPDVFTAREGMSPKEHVKLERSEWKKSRVSLPGQSTPEPAWVKLKKMRGKEISRREKLVGLQK